MSLEPPGSSRVRMRHVLAGMGAGVAGAIFIVAFLMAGSVWYHRSAWVPANLFSTALYGSRAYLNHFAPTSFAGIAIILVMYGVAGAVWGAIWRDAHPRFVLFYGAISGAITYILLFHLFWKRADPVLWLYAPDRQLEFANVIWGMIVARSPAFARRILEANAKPHAAEAVEVRSGEVIL